MQAIHKSTQNPIYTIILLASPFLRQYGWASQQYARVYLIFRERPVDGWHVRRWYGLRVAGNAIEASPYLEF